MTLCTLAAVQIYQNGRFRWYVLGAVALGFAFSTKYSGVVAGLPLILGHFLQPGIIRSRNSWLKLLGAGIIALTAAVLASPYYLTSLPQVWQDVYTALIRAGQVGFEGWQVDADGGYLFYLKTLVWGLGIGLSLLAGIGVIAALLRHKGEDLILLSLPLALYLLLGRQEMYFARFILPIIPALLILAAAWLERLLTKTIPKPAYSAGVLAGVVVLLSLQPLSSSMRLDYLLTQTDTRSQAKQWIEANLPPGTKIAQDWEFYAASLSSDAREYPGTGVSYLATNLGGQGLPENTLDWYREQGFAYLVTSSHISRLVRQSTRQQALRESFYTALEGSSPPVAEFRPQEGSQTMDFIFDELYAPAISLWQRQRPGPTITIFRIDGN